MSADLYPDIKAAAERLNSLYMSGDEFARAARAILKHVGDGAARFDAIAPEHQAAVLAALRGAIFARAGLGPISFDAEPPTPKDDQDPQWVDANWIWMVQLKRFIRLFDAQAWDKEQFDSYYNNLLSRGASYANHLFKTGGIRKLQRQAFRPGKPVWLDDGQVLNLWRPSPIIPKKGDTTLWRRHIEWLLPNERDRELMLNWLAWVYQHQDRHPNYGLLLIGKTFGTGKSWIARVMEQLIGKDNTQRPKSSSIGGQFNGWAARCKLCILEELMHVGRLEVANNIRDWITEDSFEVNIKNVPAFSIENYIAFFGLSNHTDALPLEKGERRWMVIETPITAADKAALLTENPDYFADLFAMVQPPDRDALGAIAWELKHRKLDGYEALGAAPITAAKERMIELNKGSLQAWLEENRANPPFNRKLVNIRADILPCVPDDLDRGSTKRAEMTIGKFLENELGGVNLGDHRVRLKDDNISGPDERNVKLWAINGAATSLANVSPVDRSKLYMAERDQPPPLAPDDVGANDFVNDRRRT